MARMLSRLAIRLTTGRASRYGCTDPPRFKLLDVLPLEERRAQGACNRHIVEDAPLPFNAERHNFFSYCLAIPSRELDKLIKPTSGLEESVGEVKSESRAIVLLPGFQIVQQPPDVSEEQMNLGILAERRVNLRKGVFHVPMLVG